MKLATSALLARVIVASIALLWAAAIPQTSFAQSDPMIGTWKLNLAKSTYKPGPPPRSVTLMGVATGQGVTVTADAVTAAGVATHAVFTIAYDGKFHPITGSQVADANAALRTDPYTVEYAYTKDGSLVQIGTITFARDGRSLTIASRGISVLGAGQRVDNVAFYDKQ